MRFCLPQDLLRGACRGEVHKHTRPAAVVGAGGQLSVGKRAGPALAELYVGLRIQHSRAQEPLHILPSLVDAASSFDEKRRGSRAGERQRREQTCRSRPADDRASFRASLQPVGKRIGPRHINRESFLAVPERHRRRNKEMHIRLFSRVHAAPEQNGLDHVGRLYAEFFRAGRSQIPIKRKPYIPNLDHVDALLPAASPEAKAQCRLYPPQRPSMSRASPMQYSPGTRRLSSVSGSNCFGSAPPRVT